MSEWFDIFDDGGGQDLIGLEARQVCSGIRLAKVTNIKDPEKHNRVKVRLALPEADKDILETDWCPVVMPLSGKGSGVFMMPSVDDLVLISYLDGNPNCPYVIGGTWNPKSPAPYTVADGKNINFSVKTPGGSELLFYDEKDKEKISLSTPSKAELHIDDEKKNALLTDKDKKNQISLNWEKGEIEIKADKKITITAGKSSIVLDGSGKITIKSDTSVEIKSAGITTDASNANKVSGSSVEVGAKGKLTLKGATADLKGSAGVNIN